MRPSTAEQNLQDANEISTKVTCHSIDVDVLIFFSKL
jgi:hypothetical protein